MKSKSKNFFKALSFIIAVLMCANLLTIPLMLVSADDALPDTSAFYIGSTFQNYNKDTGNNGWFYQYYRNETYTNLNVFFSEPKLWSTGSALWQGYPGIGEGMINPGNLADGVATYVAPMAGIVRLSTSIFGEMPTQSAGAEVAIFQNNTKIWPSGNAWLFVAAEDSPPFIPLEIAIKEGDQLHFRVNPAGSDAYDSFRWDPRVTYLSDVYDAELDLEANPQIAPDTIFDYTKQFSDTQGPMWYYQYSPQGGNTYERYDKHGLLWGNNYWSLNGDDVVAAGIISSFEVLTGFGQDAVIAFKAPYTGTVKIKSKTGFIEIKNSKLEESRPEYQGDGVEFGVFLRDNGKMTTLYPPVGERTDAGMKYLADASKTAFAEITVNVKKNEFIWFRINCGPNGKNNHDSVFFTPIIEYTDLDYNDAGVPDEDTVIKGRVSRPAGSNLADNAYPVTARNFTSAPGTVNSEDILSGIENGTLAKGVYAIANNGALDFTGQKNKTYDFYGYKFISSTNGTSQNILLSGIENLTIKNLTLEVQGMPHIDEFMYLGEIMQIENANGVLNLENVEIIDNTVSSDDYDGLLLFSANSDGNTNLSVVVDGARFVAQNKIAAIFVIDYKNLTVKNSYLSGVEIVASSQNGAWIENNTLINSPVTLNSNGTAIYNTINNHTLNSKIGITAYNNDSNILIALNKINSYYPIKLQNITNGVILLNEIESGSLGFLISDSKSITIAENTFNNLLVCKIEMLNVDYALGANNINLLSNEIAAMYCTELSGDDFNAYSLPEVGANFDLLPKLNKELFVNMPRKSVVTTDGNTSTLNNYIGVNYADSYYVIIPPGAYSATTLSMSKTDDYTIYAYGVLAEFSAYANAVALTNCSGITIKGLTIDYTVPVNGQATVTGKSGNNLIVQVDEGYNQNLLDSSKYAVGGNTQWFKQGSKTVSDIQSGNILTATGNPGEFRVNAFRNAAVGDKLAFRGRDQYVTYFNGCSNMRLEDYTIYSGGGFGFMEREGGEATTLYRFAVTPGPAPVLAGGRRGEERLTSTCDATHSTNMRGGLNIINSRLESMTDDGTNINAEFASYVSFNAGSKTLTYQNGNNQYAGMCAPFKTGDRVLIYTKNGELICDTVATSNSVRAGSNYTVQIADTFTAKPDTIIQNASASGNDFLIKNTLLYGNWTKGFLIKAIGGEISNCTIDSVGINGIYIAPELTGGIWNECGYAENVLVDRNYITNTGYMYSNDILYSSIIGVRGDEPASTDPNFMMMRNITITNNIVENRHSQRALHINGGYNILVENNDWGYMANKTLETDLTPSARITTSMNIKLNDNIYPPNAVPRIEYAAVSTVNIFGTDIGTAASELVDVKLTNEYKDNKWYIVLSLLNKTEDAHSIAVNFTNYTTGLLDIAGETVYDLEANELKTVYYEVKTLPVDMTPSLKIASATLRFTINENPAQSGVLIETFEFNYIVKTKTAPTSATDPIWDKTGVIKAAYDADPNYNASIKLLWDDEYLYMLADVNDPSHWQSNPASDIWDGDSVQLAIQPGRTDGLTGHVELGFALNNSETALAYCWINSVNSQGTGDLSAKGFNTVVERDDIAGKTVYMVAIPWSFAGTDGNAPLDGEIIGVSACINNKDNNDTRKYYEFYGGIASGKDSSQFGSMLMVPSQDIYATIKPQAIRDLEASTQAGTVDEGTITFTWVNPNNEHSAIDMYEIYMTNGGNKWLDTPVKIFTDVPFATLTFAELGITKSGDYDFRIRAINAFGIASFVYLGGENRYKLSVVVEVLEPTAKPKVITNFNAVLNGEAITFSWVNPNPEKSATTVETYSLYKTSGGSVWLEEAITINAAQTTVDNGITSVTLTFEELGIAKSGNYDFRIKARNNIDAASYVYIGGENRYKVKVEIESLVPIAKPKAVTNFNATSDGETVTFTWINPNNSATAVESYELTRTNTGNTWQNPITIEASEITVDEGITSATFTLEDLGIDKNGSYDFRIKAINDEGVSALTYLGGGTSSDPNRYRLTVEISVVVAMD